MSLTDALIAARTLAQGVAETLKPDDSEAFKRSLIRALDRHLARIQAPAPPRAQAQIARRVVPSGRVQAARHDSPRGRRGR